ncbi:unnamed protein product [marine sediment metagenome]|uniref:Uncharacterized protein n=1 Tax=marine sediment metagenome TaxID=412755 RepID=X0XCH9_9ZZZZ
MDYLAFIVALVALVAALVVRDLCGKVKLLKEENEDLESQRKVVADGLRKKALECVRLGKEVMRLTKELIKARRI